MPSLDLPLDLVSPLNLRFLEADTFLAEFIVGDEFLVVS
jgi:hypothetical protein